MVQCPTAMPSETEDAARPHAVSHHQVTVAEFKQFHRTETSTDCVGRGRKMWYQQVLLLDCKSVACLQSCVSGSPQCGQSGCRVCLFSRLCCSNHQLLVFEVEAIDWWRGVEGGACSQEDAQSKWDNLVATYKEQGLPFDYEGPAAAPLRIRVHMHDDVDYANRVVDGREARLHSLLLIKLPRHSSHIQACLNFTQQASGIHLFA